MAKFIKASFSAEKPRQIWKIVLDYSLENYDVLEISLDSHSYGLLKAKLKAISKNLIYTDKEEEDQKKRPRNTIPIYVFKYSVDNHIIKYLKKELKFFFAKGLIRILFRKAQGEPKRRRLLDTRVQLMNIGDTVWIYNDHAVYGRMKNDLFLLLKSKGYDALVHKNG